VADYYFWPHAKNNEINMLVSHCFSIYKY